MSIKNILNDNDNDYVNDREQGEEVNGKLSISDLNIINKEKEANKITWEYKITDEYSEYVASNFHISISEIDNYR